MLTSVVFCVVYFNLNCKFMFMKWRSVTFCALHRPEGKKECDNNLINVPFVRNKHRLIFLCDAFHFAYKKKEISTILRQSTCHTVVQSFINHIEFEMKVNQFLVDFQSNSAKDSEIGFSLLCFSFRLFKGSNFHSLIFNIIIGQFERDWVARSSITSAKQNNNH